jgi:hypothetical protein
MKNFNFKITKTSEIVQRERPFMYVNNLEILDHLQTLEASVSHSIKIEDNESLDFEIQVGFKLLTEMAFRN